VAKDTRDALKKWSCTKDGAKNIIKYNKNKRCNMHLCAATVCSIAYLHFRLMLMCISAAVAWSSALWGICNICSSRCRPLSYQHKLKGDLS
jgi:hypothetical protein